MSLTIYSYPFNPRVFKSLIAAQYNGIKIDVPPFDMPQAETPEFLAKFPLGKVPAMDTPQGPLYEHLAMLKYVAGLRPDTGLLGQSYYHSALIDQWLYWGQNEVDAPVGLLVYPILGYLQYNKKTHDAAFEAIEGSLCVLNQHLKSHTFLVGERISAADISISMSLLMAFKLIFAPAIREKYANVTRWFTTLVNQPQFAAVLGEVQLAAEEAKPDAGKPKEEKKQKPKEEKAAEPAKPKEDKKKKKKDDDEDDMEEEVKEAKPRLPKEEEQWIASPSTMDLDSVKRLFSNNKFDAVVNDFWTGFDHNLFTVWECQYKYNEDNRIGWQTANLMGGFLQRLEEARKVAYGAVVMTSMEAPFCLSGCFIFKYKEVPTFVKDSADYDSFSFSQIDVTTDAGKARMATFWKGEEIDGKPVNERRFFK